MEALDERACAHVHLGVEIMVRVTVPPEKPRESQHVGVTRTTDDDGSADPALEQPDAP